MKVITIGRSSENDITVNNPKVSRHHCQIVQFDNGTFGIVDFDSSNGTFVNGQRVYGQIPLKWGDRVHIAQTELPWQQYFPAASQKRTNWWLWPTIGGAAAIMFLAVVVVLWWTGLIGAKEIMYNGPEPPITTVTLVDDDVCYDVEAAEGQVIVMFGESVSHRKAMKMLKNNNAKIISQIPDMQYYLVEVPAGKEAKLYSILRNCPEVDYVYPNAIEVVCSVTPHVIDDFRYSDHVDRAVAMLKGCSPLMDVKPYNVGIGDKFVDTYKADRYFNKILKKLKNDESAVINMSFGPGFIKGKSRILWNNAIVTESDKINYIKKEVNFLVGHVEKAKRFKDKDFVVTISSGNIGMKHQEWVFQEIKRILKPEEYAVFERHFILVSAKDDYYQVRGLDYPNDVSIGKYDRMITKVDISDMTAVDTNWSGTSFSSPRVAGYITAVANSNNIKVTDVLEYVRKATKKAPDHILTQELLEKAIEEETKKDNSKSEYKSYGCLKYRLIKGNELENERLELHNTCDEDIRVTGYLINAIAPHGGENTIDFEIIVRANGTEYVEGFLENECTIKSVEKEPGTPSEPASSSNPTSCQSIPSDLIGTRWTTPQIHDNWTGKKRTLNFISRNQVVITYETLFFMISTSDEVPAPDVVRYNCYYDPKLDRIVVLNNENHRIMELKYKDGCLIDPGVNSFGEIEYIKL